MRRVILVSLLIVVAFAGVAVLSLGRPEPGISLATLQERGVIRIGLDASFPPFELVSGEGEVKGLDAVLASLIAERLGVRAEIHNIAFDGLYDALAAGIVDILISALPYDPLRTEDVIFSPQYFAEGVVIISSSEEVAHLGQDTAIGVEMGSEASMIARETFPQATLVEYLSEIEVLAAVAAGETKQGLVSRTTACLYRKDGGNIVVGRQLTVVPYCVAVKASNPLLAELVAETVIDITRSEQWREAVAHWVGEGC